MPHIIEAFSHIQESSCRLEHSLGSIFNEINCLLVDFLAHHDRAVQMSQGGVRSLVHELAQAFRAIGTHGIPAAVGLGGHPQDVAPEAKHFVAVTNDSLSTAHANLSEGSKALMK